MTSTETPLPDDVAADGFHASLVNGLPEAVLVASPDGRITFANAAVEALFGYRSADLVGESLLKLVPQQPGRRADVVTWLSRWAAEPDPEQSRFLDLTARHADGSERVVEVRVRSGVVRGEPRYFLSVRDNTARRQEQIALKEANLRSLRILLAAEDAVISVDANLNIIFFNPAAEAMFGYGVDEVTGQPLDRLLPADMRAGHAAHMERFRSSKRASRMMGERSVVWGQRKSGERFPVEAAISRVTIGQTLTFTAQLRDVTRRLHDEERLRESERRIRAVFDNATEAVALLTPEGDILEINRAGGALTTDAGHLVGRKLWDAPWAGLETAGQTSAAGPLRDALSAAAVGVAAGLDVTLSRDGAPVPVRVRLTPILEAGKVVYILAEGRLETT